MRRDRKYGIGLVTLLALAMVIATFLQSALGVLSSFIIGDFETSRSLFGIVFAVLALVGGTSSVLMGALTDRNSRAVMLGLFALSAVGMIASALAPNYVILLLAMVPAGLALGSSNPVTNRLVAEQLPLRRRALAISIKQSGPTLGLLVAGLILAPLAVSFGWRLTLLIGAMLPVAGAVATGLTLTKKHGDGIRSQRKISELDEDVRATLNWLTTMGFGVAVANSAIIAFLPLFAQEELALSPSVAGAVAAAMGLAGVAGRLFWGGLGNHFKHETTALLAISVLSVISVLALAISSLTDPLLLWAGAIGCGATVLAWHAIAWLVLINRVDLGAVGKASGLLQMGGTIGFAIGPPLFGVVADGTDSYPLAWSLVAGLMGVVTLLTIRARSSTPKRTGTA